MAIQPVKYKNDSSTAGFAEAGDTIAITSNNANTIKKDVDQGNTESLNNAQQKWLDKWVDEDTLDYSDEEMQKVGEQQIDAEDTENTNGAKTGTSMGLAAGGAVGAAAGGAVAGAGAGAIAGYAQLTSAAAKTAKIPWMALAAGGMDLAIGAAAIIAVNMFDDQYQSRMSKKDAAGETNTILQQYTDKMNSDMDAMAEESGTYVELSDMTTQMTMDSITNIGALQAEMQVYQAQGNTEKVAELKGQIEKLQGSSEKELEEPQKEMDTIKENVAQYTGNNAEAQGVLSSGASVAEFLSDGKQMGILGTANAAILTISALLMLQGTFDAAKAALSVPWPGNIAAGIVAAAGAVMMVAGNVMVGLGAFNMARKGKDEFSCSDAGGEMQGNVNSLGENVEGQAGFTEAAAAGYTETDEASTEMTEQTQKETDKANQKQAQALGGQTKPEEKKKEEKPDVTANAGGGAGAGAGAGGAAA